MQNKTNNQYQTNPQGGLSLVELMIAMTLGLILIGGVTAVYLSSKASYRLEDGLAQVQESGRFASHFLIGDARMAGYMGCTAEPASLISTINAGSAAYDSFLYAFSVAIQGFDANAGGTWSPTPDNSLTSLTHKPVAGSDILTVRTTVGNGVSITEAMPKSSAELKVKNSSAFEEGDIVALSDCSNVAVFQVTKSQSSDHVQHNSGTPASGPGNSSKNLGKQYGPGSSLTKMATVSYFIAPRDASDTDCSSGTCGLWRKVGDDPEEELVPGIENMQVRYGVDTASDSIPDRYVSASSGVDWSAVVSLRVALLTASSGPALDDKPVATPEFTLLNETVSAAANDLRLRRVFVNTISIRNRTL